MRAAFSQSSVFWFVFLAKQKMNARPGEGPVRLKNITSYLRKKLENRGNNSEVPPLKTSIYKGYSYLWISLKNRLKLSSQIM